jgi:hypothetical protein
MHRSLVTLLQRSADLQIALQQLAQLRPSEDSPRIAASRIMCSVAFEHAESAKVLITVGNFTSAIGLVRLQYEALVRAMWLRYAASDPAVTRLMGQLTREDLRRTEKKLPMLTEMLRKLEGRAPERPMSALLDFRDHLWKPLSSYVHGGVDAVHRHGKGYPLLMLIDVLKASNALALIVGMLLSALAADRSASAKVHRLREQYADCLPDGKPAGT